MWVWSEKNEEVFGKDRHLIRKFTRGKYRVQVNESDYKIIKVEDDASTPNHVTKTTLVGTVNSRSELIAIVKLIMASEEE